MGNRHSLDLRHGNKALCRSLDEISTLAPNDPATGLQGPHLP